MLTRTSLLYRRTSLSINLMIVWLFIFFLSGLSGLIYQVVWVREFGQIFGNTVHSASLVTGIFLFGLGLGSYIAGRFVDRRSSANSSLALKCYVITELLITVLGVLSAVLIYRFEALSPYITNYTVSANGWFEVSTSSFIFRTLILLLLIGPLTVAMGATLTFLIRHFTVSAPKSAGWKVGLLYGINTLGAAVGCLITDAWAVPSLGLLATKMSAVGLNLIVALLGLYFLNKNNNNELETVNSDTPVANKGIWLAGVSLAISGFCAMGMEQVWFRFASSLFSSHRMAFSLTLFIILVGIWVGALLAGAISKRVTNVGSLYILTQLLFSTSVVISFLFFINSRRLFFLDVLSGPLSANQESFRYRAVELLFYLIPLAKIVLFPAIVMGAAYPLINALIQRDRANVGTNAGFIYLLNSVGALFGSLLTGFYLIPKFGMQTSTLCLSAFSLFAVLPILYFYSRDRFSLKTGAIAFFAIVPPLVSLGYWASRDSHYVVLNGYLQKPLNSQGAEVLTISEGINETAMVVKNKNDNSLSLYTNGHSMSAANDSAQRYMRAFAHLPLLQIENPKSALVICFGVGNTLNAVSRHPSIETIDIVDLSKNILGLASYFADTNQNVLQDPRVNVYINDGRQHLRMQNENTYDLITLEPPPLKAAGVASLYSEEFYRIAEKALKPGGMITQWLPIHQVSGEHARQLIRAFTDVFPNAVLVNGSYMTLILMGQKEGANEIDWFRVKERIAQRPLVQQDLARIKLSKPIEFLGTFMASGPWMTKNLADVVPLQDNQPNIEYSRKLLYSRLPKELFWAGTFADWCPSCFKGEHLAGELARLDTFLSMMQSYYWNEEVLKVTPVKQETLFKIQFVDSLPPATRDTLIHPVTTETFNSLVEEYPYFKVLGFSKVEN